MGVGALALPGSEFLVQHLECRGGIEVADNRQLAERSTKEVPVECLYIITGHCLQGGDRLIDAQFVAPVTSRVVVEVPPQKLRRLSRWIAAPGLRGGDHLLAQLFQFAGGE